MTETKAGYSTAKPTPPKRTARKVAETRAEYVSQPEAARLLGVHVQTVRAMVERGDLPAVTSTGKDGRTMARIPRAALEPGERADGADLPALLLDAAAALDAAAEEVRAELDAIEQPSDRCDRWETIAQRLRTEAQRRMIV